MFTHLLLKIHYEVTETMFCEINLELFVIVSCDKAETVMCFPGDTESAKFQAACSRFKRLFAMPEEEKLVNCKLLQ